MSRRRSLTYRFVVGFAIIVSPLVLFLFFHNIYAMKVVKTQVAGTSTTQLNEHVSQTDELMDLMNNYLYVLNDREPDIGRMSLFPFGSDEYVLNKRRIFNRLSTDIEFFRTVDSIFVYNLRDDDLVLQSQSNYQALTPTVKQYVRNLMETPDAASLPNWVFIPYGTTPKLMKIAEFSDTIAVGAMIDIQTTLEPLRFIVAEKGGGIAAADPAGTILIGSDLTEEMNRFIRANAGTAKAEPETTDVERFERDDYLILSKSTRLAPIRYVVFIPKTVIFKKLLFFQNVLYYIPAGGMLILLLYFTFLQSVLLRPMKKLIKAMNQIMRGDFKTRLEDDRTTEFVIVNRTFNQMIAEISNLKIHVYEEKLRTKEAEFKHLQAQIKPHFYLNSLNIINSLVVTRQYELIHRMTRYLAEYFRFSISTNQDRVLVRQELRHTANYLEIQKLRFPGKLSYEIEVSEDNEEAEILPLSIQTFVENAIIHGFVDRHEPFFVRIRVSEHTEGQSRCLEVRIRDNGAGFPESVLRDLQSGVYEQDVSQRESLGIYNVMLRLQMSYGGDTRIQFENADDRGAVVTLRIPFRLEQKGFDEDAAI